MRSHLVLAVSALSLALSAPSFAAPICPDDQDYGQWPQLLGSTESPSSLHGRAITTQGDYAYVGVGGSLHAVSLTDPSSLQLGDPIAPTARFVFHLDANASWLVSANGPTSGSANRLDIYSLTNPAVPVHEEALTSIGPVIGLELLGDVVLVAESFEIYTVDFTSPGAPVVLDTLPMPSQICDLAVQGGRAFVTTNVGQLMQIDVSDTSGLEFTGAAPSIDYFVCSDGNLSAQGDYLYVVGYESNELQNMLGIFNISNEDSPALVGSLPGVAGFNNVSVHGDLAVLAGPGKNLWFVDVGDPTDPRILHSVPAGERIDSIVVTSDVVLASMDFLGLKSFSKGTASGPRYLSIARPGGRFDGLAVEGETLYQFYTEALPPVIERMDISDPTLPVPRTPIQATGNDVRQIKSDSVYLYVGHTLGLDIFDLGAEPPTYLDTAYVEDDLFQHVYDFALHGDRAILALGQGLQAVDITSPETSFDRDLGYLPINSNTISVAVAFDRAYALAGNFLYVVDISGDPLDLSQATIQPAVQTWFPGTAIDIEGNRAYVATSAGVEVFDLSNPDAPTSIYQIDVPAARNVIVGGEYAYVAALGMTLIDISEEAPAVVARTGMLAGTAIAIGPSGVLGGGWVGLGSSVLYQLPRPCGKIVPAFVSNFSVRSSNAGVIANWQSFDGTCRDDLRLAKVQASRRHIVPHECNLGSYDAVDPLMDMSGATVEYMLQHRRSDGAWQTIASESVSNSSLATGVSLRAAPNPVRESTALRFSLDRSSLVRLSIYDTRGRLISNLINEELGAGVHAYSWDGRDRGTTSVAAGVYFARLETDSRTQSTRLLVIR